MDRRFQGADLKTFKLIFLVVTEFAAFKRNFLWCKKEFNEINDSLKKNYFDGDGLHEMFTNINALQRAETSVIDGATG